MWFPITPSYTAELLLCGYSGVMGLLLITVTAAALGSVLTVIGSSELMLCVTTCSDDEHEYHPTNHAGPRTCAWLVGW